VISQGISKVESTVTFGIVEAFNRKLIDNKARRYFFVKDPVKLVVEDAPSKEKSIDFHPTDKKLGSRTIKTGKTFFVQKVDIEKIKTGDVFRLKDLFNVKIKEKNDTIFAKYKGDKLISESAKIQWTTDNFVKMKVFVPHLLFEGDTYNPDSLETVPGFAEKAVSAIKTGEIIQFERFGFVRIENTDNKLIGFFAHK